MVSLSPFRALRPADDVVARTVDGSLRGPARASMRRHHRRHTSWLEAFTDDAVASVDEWVADGSLAEDDAPRLRLVEQQLPGGHLVAGVLGLARLADLVPHERTDAAAVRRRVQRDRRQRVEARPLLAVLPTDPPDVADLLGAVRRTSPETEVLDERGVRHRVWVCDDEAAASIGRSLAPLPCLLADGHHRAAAATTAGRADAMTLVSFASAPPRLLPVWRIGAIPPQHRSDVHGWLDGLPAGTDVRVHFEGRTRGVGGDGVELPVETSQRIAASAPGVARVTTTADPAATAVAEQDGAVVVAAAAPSVTDVLSAIAAGRPLPPKSTAFSPKPRVGLTLRRL